MPIMPRETAWIVALATSTNRSPRVTSILHENCLMAAASAAQSDGAFVGKRGHT
jgi:hypothetical protein